MIPRNTSSTYAYTVCMHSKYSKKTNTSNKIKLLHSIKAYEAML